MWNAITSFFWKSAPEVLSLQEACDILKVDEENPEESVLSESEEGFNEFDTCQKVGKITHKADKKFKIDDIYSFESDNELLVVGSKVSYKVFISNLNIKITDVKLIENDWDLVESKKSTWCLRTLVLKVEKKQGRIIILNPGNINVDLNKISTEFIPIVGDWVELYVKCEIDEGISDLCGNILEVNKISPVRPHVQKCSITSYDPKHNFGVINRNVYFKSSCLPHGYIPCNGDKVIAEVIESDQNNCNWRVLRLIPEDVIKKHIQITDCNYSDILFNHEEINIQSEDVLIDKLGVTEQFFILIENNSSDSFNINSTQFLNSRQCKILSELKDCTLKSKEIAKIICECDGKTVGESRELFVVEFDNFKMGHWVYIKIEAVKAYVPVNFVRKSSRYTNNVENNVIRGQRVAAPTRFLTERIPEYSVPKKLLNIFAKYNKDDHLEYANLRGDLSLAKPSLFNNLSIMNYEDKFHTLLHLEEISNLIAVQAYNQDLACFIRNGEYLMLEINNLHEKRPSLLVGDKIIATDPSNENKTDFEGYIHKVSANHVYLKFSYVFQDSYNGEDYAIRASCQRGSYKRMHHAVFLAVRNLGKDILFCSQLIEKEPQILVKAEDTKKQTPKQVLKKIAEYNNKSPSEKQDYREKQLNMADCSTTIEWYNKSLNYYQKEAVRNILLGVSRPLPYIIFGPPGTGKTITIIETILQILRLIPQSRLLIAAPSNSAADLIALRLIDSGVLQPGHLIRVISHTYLLSELIPSKLVPYSATLNLAIDGTGAPEEISQAGLRLGCSSATIGRHRITISTCGTAGRMFGIGFKKDHFTHIVVDEAGQASEPEVLTPVTFLNKYEGQVILAGDPVQLGPIVMNKISKECGLGESFLERLLNRFPYLRDVDGFPDTAGYDPRLVTKLRYNYRSLEPLLKLTSSLFYNDDLIPTISNTDSDEANTLLKLKEMLPSSTNSDNIPCIVFHGVMGENCRSADSPSWYNPHEAAQIFYYVNELYRLGMASSDIGIITPYVKQSKEIRSILNEAEFDLPKIGTVEEFQGQEYKVILLSTVRSSQSFVNTDIAFDLGFMSCPRRLNVAISRARALLVIVGNPNVLSKDVTWRSVIKYCMDSGAYTGCQICA